MTEEEARALISSVCDGWYTAILRYAWRLCGCRELAEDLVQDALLQLYAELRSGHIIENPRAWVVIVVRRQAAKQSAAWRQQATHTVSLDVLENFSALTTAAESPYPEGDALTGLLGVLTKREQEVIFLRMAAMRYREIGKQLGISVSAVNTLLARALRKLRAASGADRNENSRHTSTASCRDGRRTKPPGTSRCAGSAGHAWMRWRLRLMRLPEPSRTIRFFIRCGWPRSKNG